MSTQLWAEFRQWVQLLFVVIGGALAIAAYRQNLKQRRVENALKFIGLFREGLQKEDLSHWKELFKSTSESAGAPYGAYFNSLHNAYRPLSDCFSEGSGGDHAISRLAQSLDVICHQVNTGAADAQTIYYELGQVLVSVKGWLESISGHNDGESLLQSSFPSIDSFFGKYGRHVVKWPYRAYTYVE